MLPYRCFLHGRYTIPMLRNVSTQASLLAKLSRNNDFEVNPRFVNRNPRNLEQMLLARKPTGWEWDRPSRTYWYRLEIEVSNKNIYGRVVHNGGSRVAEASTTEWGIKKQLVSTADSSAAFAVGCVLARRCLESGLVAIHVELSQQHQKSRKTQSLLDGLVEEGLTLKEPGDLNEIEERPCATIHR
ncbi:39S ribosomal protein L18 [Tropilaelaps mercedesae]|uniref:Large ribosomal subunit protein uL18m n=1 Tax=Tropilaelaps mercedesae TaxID=418985 RepID=A0A1V9XPI0_9ACAR|nr:39S ribosomal protein L18 [Tropilaelaps mercedesae]